MGVSTGVDEKVAMQPTQAQKSVSSPYFIVVSVFAVPNPLTILSRKAVLIRPPVAVGWPSSRRNSFVGDVCWPEL